MADEQNTGEGELGEVEVSRAKGMGWVPQENFRGDPAKWIDAKTFLKRGDEVMPILRSQNKRLEETVGQTRAQLEAQTRAFQELQGSVTELQKFYAEQAKQQAARIRTELLAELKQARKDDDVEAEVVIQGKLNELTQNPPEPAAAPAPAPATPPVDPEANPEYQQFLAENSWFKEDQVLASAALAVGDALIKQHKGQLRGKAFFDEVAKTMRERFPEQTGTPARAPSKVDGARSSGGQGGGGGNGTSYSDLPPEAKDVCKKEAEKFVGPNKAFKDLASWQAEYARIYFGS